MSKEALFDIISSLSGLIPLIAFAFNFKNLDRIFKLIGVFFIISAFADLLQWLLPFWHYSNIWVVHIFVIVNIVFFCVIYYKAFVNSLNKRITLILSSLALVAGLYSCKDIFEYPTISNTASSIVFIILSLLLFFQLLTRQEFVHIEKQGLFWFNAAVLFYFSINIFLFMLIAMIPLHERPSYYIINNITNIIANLLYTIALLCRPQKTT